jgi:hypothetical protein
MSAPPAPEPRPVPWNRLREIHADWRDTQSRRPGTCQIRDSSDEFHNRRKVPSGGAVGTARAIAHASSVFAAGGHELGLRQETLQAMSGGITTAGT